MGVPSQITVDRQRRILRRLRRWAVGLTAAGLAPMMLIGWVQDATVEPALPQMRLAAEPVIATGADGVSRSMELSVLTYNVEGLPWPVRYGRPEALRRIGDRLAELRSRGMEPDVVLIQEAFTSDAGGLARRAGYPNFVRGPDPGDVWLPEGAPDLHEHLLERSVMKGEQVGKFASSGLYILSNYPILVKAARPFSPDACAGYDCLANKGAVLARISVPGLPTPVDIVTTHKNAQGASGVPLARAHAAHRLQTDELARFLREMRAPDNPLIMGGDFNVRRSPARFEYAANRYRVPFVRQWCLDQPGACVADMDLPGPEPWLKTQDLQAFDDGAAIRVRPVHLSLMFEQAGDYGLSDHDGYLVTYRLTWNVPDRGAGT